MKVKIVAAGVASTLMLGGMLVGATPANATTKCTSNRKEFPTDWYDADVTVKLCVRSENGGHFADGYVSWSDAGSNKFDRLKVQVRPERYDADIAVDTCSSTAAINSTSTGDAFCGIGSFAGGSGGWTADGHVVYNINNDRKGDFTWFLHGSLMIN